jgi:hypothetical protein
MSEREDVVETVDVQTVAVTTPAPIAKGTPREGTGQQPITSGQQPIADLGKVRELVLKAHPDVVPDLVAGSSVDELIASVEPARSAYQRIADRVREAESDERRQDGETARRHVSETAMRATNSSDVRAPTSDSPVGQPPAVPAGGATNVAEPGEFAPTTRIAQALAARKQK